MKTIDFAHAKSIADSYGAPGSKGLQPPASVEDDPVQFEAAQLAGEIVKAYQRDAADTGAPSLLGDGSKLTILLAVLALGNYRATAADAARIGARTLQAWMQRGEEDDKGGRDTVYALLYELVCHAEAYSEIRARWNITKAGDFPHLWTANAWGLERKHPDRWGRRTDDNDVPRVVVQIGVSQGDVQVRLAAPPHSPALPASTSAE